MAFRANVDRRDDWFVGEDKSLQFTIWADKAKTTRQDVSGWTFAYDFYAGGAVAFTVTSADSPGIVVTDGPQGEVTVSVASEHTDALTDRSELHHVLRRADVGNEAILAVGDVILNDPAEV